MKQCIFKNCERSADWRDDGKRGYCAMHYRRWQRYGDASVVKRNQQGEGGLDGHGYRYLFIDGKRIYEHTHVVEQHLGRKLLGYPDEVIHHKNGDKLDNRLENLLVISQQEHAKLHAVKRYAYLDISCNQCGNSFRTTSWRLKRQKRQFCSKVCASKARRIGGLSHVKHYAKSALLNLNSEA